MPNKEEKETEEVTGPPDVYVGKDNLENYMHFRCITPSNPVEAYTVKRQCIEFGKELLPSFIDPDETDKEQIIKNQKEQEETTELYELACTTLKNEVLGKREIKFEHLIRDHRVYRITADDAKPCEAVKEELETVLNNFINQQHEQHMKMLVEVDSKIFHVLSMNEIVPMVNPTLEEMREGYKKDKFRERHEGNGGNN